MLSQVAHAMLISESLPPSSSTTASTDSSVRVDACKGWQQSGKTTAPVQVLQQRRDAECSGGGEEEVGGAVLYGGEGKDMLVRDALGETCKCAAAGVRRLTERSRR